MQNKHETFGSILKSARKRNGFTIEELAEQVDLSERYIYRIENNGKIPSFEVMQKLVRVLAISPDAIFFPEKHIGDTELDQVTRLLTQCDERSMIIIKAAIIAALESQKL